MNHATKRSILRWIHLIVTIPILGSIYGEPAEVQEYAGAVRFVFVPVIILSGYWMYSGVVFAVIAVALVRPTKSIHDVDLAAVKKKMKDKAFARAVNRDDIIRGAEQLGLPLDEVITNVIAALKSDAARLGLAGSAIK